MGNSERFNLFQKFLAIITKTTKESSRYFFRIDGFAKETYRAVKGLHKYNELSRNKNLLIEIFFIISLN